jgi:branched-chain amino acid transport system substrate-binding protein
VTLFLLLLFLAPTLASPQSQPKSLGPVDDTLLFREGEIFLAKGETEKALWRFKQLTTDFPKSSLTNEARFRMAICYTQLKKPKEANRILSDLLSTFLSPSRMIHVFTMLGDNHLEMKEPLAALQWYGKGILIPSQPNEELKRKVRSIIDTLDSEENLKQIDSLYRGAYAGGYAKLKLAERVKHRGDETQASRILSEFEKEYRIADYPSLSKETQVKQPSEPPRALRQSKYTLGVILPLSGPYQPFGEKALQGIRLGIRESQDPSKPSLISLVVRDSKGDPWEAERAAEELAGQENVIAILGPLLSITAERAAKKSQQLKVPLITFAQKELVTEKEGFVFQNSLPPSAQADALAAFAVRDLELRTFAIFYPNSPYGLLFKQLFSQEVTGRGGKVTGTVIYQEGQTDLGPEIRSFFKIKTSPRGGASQKKEENYIPGYSVDALFIPDNYNRVGLILSQMAYYNVKGTTFLGTNAWNHPSLPSVGGQSAEGSLFVDAFFKGNPSSATEYFFNEFRKTYSRDPETLEALSFEAAEYVRKILVAKMVSSPIQLKEEMRRVQDFQGPAGLTGFAEDGKALRTPSIMRVHKGQIEYFGP